MAREYSLFMVEIHPRTLTEAWSMHLAAQASCIGLKSDIILDVGRVPCNRDHGYQILEAGAILSVVDDTVLCFPSFADISPEILQSFAVHILIWSFGAYSATRVLQETAVLPYDLFFAVASQCFEAL